MWLSGLVTLFVMCVTFTLQLLLPELSELYENFPAESHINVSYYSNLN